MPFIAKISAYLLFFFILLAAALPVQAANWELDKKYYPSPIDPAFLPDGTLVKSNKSSEVFYLRNGKRSWVVRSIIDRWLGENHYFKHDIIHTLSDAELKKYPQTKSVNPIYVGKVLQHPDGTQYFIDDKLRKRKISPAVRAALKFPTKNLYPASAKHLPEFATGPELTETKKQPGGMVIYDGAYHGGRIWKIEENAAGQLTRRLYLSDYLYEADGYPDESQRVAASADDLKRYVRGPNIERYADGWVVGLNGNKYVVHKETLRLIGSPAIFSAMGYQDKYVLTKFPEFLKRYPKGEPIAAYKNIVAASAIAKGAPSAAPNTAYNLTKVRPAVRELIAQINDLALPIYDRQLTAEENRNWVDYVYSGEVDNKADLINKMDSAVAAGKIPGKTSRTATIDLDLLKSKWFPYLFYFVWQQEPSEAARDYWYNRIAPGDRDTIGKLGETLQWLKDTSGQMHR